MTRCFGNLIVRPAQRPAVSRKIIISSKILKILYSFLSVDHKEKRTNFNIVYNWLKLVQKSPKNYDLWYMKMNRVHMTFNLLISSLYFILFTSYPDMTVEKTNRHFNDTLIEFRFTFQTELEKFETIYNLHNLWKNYSYHIYRLTIFLFLTFSKMSFAWTLK